MWRRTQVSGTLCRYTLSSRLILTGLPRHNVTEWTQTPFYVVGEATATALASIRTITDPAHVGLAPLDIRGATESGTSEKLAHFILSDLPPPAEPYPPSDPNDPSPAPAPDPRRTLLYLTGDKNRDTLPAILNAGGVALRSLQVYATQGTSTFAEDLRKAIEGVTSGKCCVLP